MIDAEEAREIYSQAVKEETKAIETYLKNYVFNIIDNRVKTAAEMGQTECQISISEILSQTGEVSEHFKIRIVNTLIDILEYQKFKVINIGGGMIIINWYSPELM